jgi:hypothetical protein
MSNQERLLLALVLLLGITMAYCATGWNDREDWLLCQQAYAAAHSAADTAQVDAGPAPRQRGRGEYTASAMTTCGERRYQHQRP